MKFKSGDAVYLNLTGYQFIGGKILSVNGNRCDVELYLGKGEYTTINVDLEYIFETNMHSEI